MILGVGEGFRVLHNWPSELPFVGGE
jgi:hypothetical protein